MESLFAIIAVMALLLSVRAGRVMDAGYSPIPFLFGVQRGNALPRLILKAGQTIQRTVSLSGMSTIVDKFTLASFSGICYA